MSGETFSDSTMLEIFRAEVETHVETLTAGLLALERNPEDMSHLDGMMRGAHSIKGAARIVGIDPAVKVAHTLEDGFVAAQNGKLTLRPDHVDVLLRGVDFLSRVAQLSKDTSVDWKQLDAEALPLAAEMSAVLSSTKPPATSEPENALKPAPHDEPAKKPVKSRVPAKKLTIPFPAMFDSTAAEKARLALIDGIDSAVTRIRFDLSKTTDLDATGLAFLAAVPAQFSTGTAKIELFGAGADMQFVLKATGLDNLYPTGGQRTS